MKYKEALFIIMVSVILFSSSSFALTAETDNQQANGNSYFSNAVEPLIKSSGGKSGSSSSSSKVKTKSDADDDNDASDGDSSGIPWWIVLVVIVVVLGVVGVVIWYLFFR